MRIGIMGGTFDPIHIGHLIIGEAAYQQLHLGKVLFMPSGNPPHKSRRTGCASDAERVEMVRRGIAGNPHFVLSELEMHADGFTYTYRTLESLRQIAPETEWYFIIGEDSLKDFPYWKEPQRICDACILVVASRRQTDCSYAPLKNPQSETRPDHLKLNIRDAAKAAPEMLKEIAAVHQQNVKKFADDLCRDELDRQIRLVREQFSARIIRLDINSIDVSSRQIREWIRDGKSTRYYLPDTVREYIAKRGLYRENGQGAETP